MLTNLIEQHLIKYGVVDAERISGEIVLYLASNIGGKEQAYLPKMRAPIALIKRCAICEYVKNNPSESKMIAANKFNCSVKHVYSSIKP